MRPTLRPRAATAALAAMLLASCGGGSDSSSVPPPAAGTLPAPAEPGAAPAGASNPTGSPQASALQQLNAARSRCGFGALFEVPELDASAAAHANYMALNNSFAHEEVSGKPGFTGVQVWDRESAAGYRWTFSGEVLAQVSAGQDGADAVRHLMAAPYHAALLLEAFHDVGFGWSTVNGFASLTGDLGRRAGQQGASPSGVATYPCGGVSDAVPVTSNETPSPFPSNPSAQWGQAITVRGPVDLALNGVSVTGPSGAVQILAIYGPGQTADPNTTGDFARGAFAIIPAPLAPNTAYSVSIAYTSGGTAGRTEFSFSTSAR